MDRFVGGGTMKSTSRFGRRGIVRRVIVPLAVGLATGVLGVSVAGAHAVPKVTISGFRRANELLFGGAASGKTPVTVHVYAGVCARGPEVASAQADVVKHRWQAGFGGDQLQGSIWTAVATEPSPRGRGEGSSTPVTVNPYELPEVTIDAPQLSSNNTNPAFSGAVDGECEVVVHVFLGTVEVASANATASGGRWASGALSTPLPSGKHVFTAYAQCGDAKSLAVAFEVNTEP